MSYSSKLLQLASKQRELHQSKPFVESINTNGGPTSSLSLQSSSGKGATSSDPSGLPVELDDCYSIIKFQRTVIQSLRDRTSELEAQLSTYRERIAQLESNEAKRVEVFSTTLKKSSEIGKSLPPVQEEREKEALTGLLDHASSDLQRLQREKDLLAAKLHQIEDAKKAIADLSREPTQLSTLSATSYMSSGSVSSPTPKVETHQEANSLPSSASPSRRSSVSEPDPLAHSTTVRSPGRTLIEPVDMNVLQERQAYIRQQELVLMGLKQQQAQNKLNILTQSQLAQTASSGMPYGLNTMSAPGGMGSYQQPGSAWGGGGSTYVPQSTAIPTQQQQYQYPSNLRNPQPMSHMMNMSASRSGPYAETPTLSSASSYQHPEYSSASSISAIHQQIGQTLAGISGQYSKPPMQQQPQQPQQLALQPGAVQSPQKQAEYSVFSPPPAGVAWPESMPFFGPLADVGIPVLKHGRMGRPKRRLLWMDVVTDPANPVLVWHEGDTKDYSKIAPKNRMPLIEIIDIRAGMVGAVFERSGKQEDADKYMCFAGEQRTLDIELQSMEARDWIFKKFSDLFQAYATCQKEKLEGNAITMRVLALMDTSAGKNGKPVR